MTCAAWDPSLQFPSPTALPLSTCFQSIRPPYTNTSDFYHVRLPSFVPSLLQHILKLDTASYITSTAVSSNGSYLAFGDAVGTIHLLTVADESSEPFFNGFQGQSQVGRRPRATLRNKLVRFHVCCQSFVLLAFHQSTYYAQVLSTRSTCPIIRSSFFLVGHLFNQPSLPTVNNHDQRQCRMRRFPKGDQRTEKPRRRFHHKGSMQI